MRALRSRLLEQQKESRRKEMKLQEFWSELECGRDAVKVLQDYSRELYHRENEVLKAQERADLEEIERSKRTQDLDCRSRQLERLKNEILDDQEEFEAVKLSLKEKSRDLVKCLEAAI